MILGQAFGVDCHPHDLDYLLYTDSETEDVVVDDDCSGVLAVAVAVVCTVVAGADNVVEPSNFAVAPVASKQYEWPSHNFPLASNNYVAAAVDDVVALDSFVRSVSFACLSFVAAKVSNLLPPSFGNLMVHEFLVDLTMMTKETRYGTVEPRPLCHLSVVLSALRMP